MAAGILIGQGIAAQTVAQRARAAAMRPNWAAYAEERGLTVPEGGDLPEIVGERDGARAHVSVEIDALGMPHTRISATGPKGKGARLVVLPDPGGVLGFLKATFRQDIEIGDEAFDEAFLIRAEPEAAAAEVLAPALRAALTTASTRGFTAFTLDDGTATIQRPGLEDEAEWLDVYLGAVVAAVT